MKLSNRLKSTSFLFLLLIVAPICSMAQESEKRKIEQTLTEETEAWKNKEKEKWESFWVKSEDTRRLLTNPIYGFTNHIVGWDSISQQTESRFSNDEPSNSEMQIGNFQISINGSTAVAHAETNYIAEEDTATSMNIVVLDKSGGDWKILEYFTSLVSMMGNDIEHGINAQGYAFLWEDNIDNAIKVFELNTELFPNAWNVWDSLAEAYMEKGDNKKAIKYYKKSLELNPENENAEKYIAKLKGEM